MLPPMPDDPAAAAALANRRAMKRLERTGCSGGPQRRSGRWASKQPCRRDPEPLPVPEASAGTDPADAGPTEAPSTDVDQRIHQPAGGLRSISTAVELAGATSGSKWEAGR